MTTFALIHGAWGSGWHWASVPAELRSMGHEVVAPDLPCEDPHATFDDYAEVVLGALSETRDDDLVVVGYSLGGHTAALVAARRPVRELVYVAAMLPEPGLSLNDQFRRGDRMLLCPSTPRASRSPGRAGSAAGSISTSITGPGVTTARSQSRERDSNAAVASALAPTSIGVR